MKTSEVSFTPEPWVFAYGAVYREDTLHDESSIRLLLADRNEAHTTPVERDANCRLAAASPELLSCVRFACAWANGWKPNKQERVSFHQRCLNVIAKATGGQS